MFRGQGKKEISSTMPMEQVFKHYEKDVLKMAMLKHEETFRQQVHDLHRLYRIQKLLMRDFKREIKSQRNLSTSPNGSAEYSRPGALDVCAYEQWYGATAGGGHAATPRTALSLDVVKAVECAEETDDDAELELTLALGSGGGGGAKKRYSNEHSGSAGESFSSSSTESDVLIGGREWQQAHQRVSAGASPPYHKRRSAGFDVIQVEDGGVQPSPLLFHWLSLRMA